MNIEEIKELIPHRYPFLLIDRVDELIVGEKITVLKNVSISEPHFQGHFPEIAVMPGVLIIEAMAQAAALLVAKTLNTSHHEKITYLTAVNDTKFRKIITPGDQLRIEVKIDKHKAMIWKFTGCAYVADELVAESSFSAAVKDKN